MSEYIKFELIEQKPKTDVYEIINIRSDDGLGVIMWDTGWRRYCCFADEDTKWSDGCLDYISTFIKRLMEDHKRKKVEKR